MHYLMLVTLVLPAEVTSADARGQAQTLLGSDDSFCGEGGRFGSPLCDWFVIGGRWSGMLKEALLGDGYKAAFRQAFPDMAGDWYPASLAEKHRNGLDRLWQQFGGRGPSPHSRSGYGLLGYDDDAMIVDRALYDRFLKQYHGEAMRKDNTYRCEFIDLDDEPVDESFIGRKWLIVIDYHN